MNVALYLSIIACVSGLLFAGFTGVVARAPGLSQLRPFAVACACGALYGGCNIVLLSPVSPQTGVWANQVSLLFGGLHGVSWYFYRASRERRSLSRFERFIVGGGLVFAAIALVPRALYDEPWDHKVPWIHATYRDAHSTTLGDVCFAYYAFALSIPFVRSVRALRAGDRTEIADTIGLGALLATGVHDGLVVGAGLPTPYLLDLGYLVLVVSVAVSLTQRFIDTTVGLAEAREVLLRQERLAALGEMSAIVAHEVRNPVGVIFNALAALRKLPIDDPSRAELLAIVEEEAERLKRMVSNLLEFARPRYVALGPVDLSDLLESAVAGARSAVPDATGDVELEVAENVPTVNCDAELVRQAVVNLVSNALQAKNRRGAVIVRALLESNPPRVAIVVIDDGDGIPANEAKRIFLPFFTTRPTGVGLGLPVVQRIAEAHHGELVHQATVGGGATFILRLPLAA